MYYVFVSVGGLWLVLYHLVQAGIDTENVNIKSLQVQPLRLQHGLHVMHAHSLKLVFVFSA